MLDNTDTEYTITSAELLGWLVLLVMASVWYGIVEFNVPLDTL